MWTEVEQKWIRWWQKWNQVFGCVGRSGYVVCLRNVTEHEGSDIVSRRTLTVRTRSPSYDINPQHIITALKVTWQVCSTHYCHTHTHTHWFSVEINYLLEQSFVTFHGIRAAGLGSLGLEVINTLLLSFPCYSKSSDWLQIARIY